MQQAIKRMANGTLNTFKCGYLAQAARITKKVSVFPAFFAVMRGRCCPDQDAGKPMSLDSVR